jgi:hypothetical protein
MAPADEPSPAGPVGPALPAPRAWRPRHHRPLLGLDLHVGEVAVTSWNAEPLAEVVTHMTEASDRKYKHDTKITFWLSMPANHTAKESDTHTIGGWLGLTEAEFNNRSDDEIESMLEDELREWQGERVERGWHPS